MSFSPTTVAIQLLRLIFVFIFILAQSPTSNHDASHPFHAIPTAELNATTAKRFNSICFPDLEPIISAEELMAGFEQNTETALLLIGKHAVAYRLPVQHLSKVCFFRKAFNGNFKESETNTINLPDEDPDAFRIFVTWLYQGIYFDFFEESYLTLTRFLLMVDKWCLNEQTRNRDMAITSAIIIHSDLSRAMRDEITTTDCGEPSREYWIEILDCYNLIKPLRFRYVFVHAFWVGRIAATTALLQVMNEIVRDQPGFLFDFLRWEEMLNWAIGDGPKYDFMSHPFLNREEAHVVDLVLRSVLNPTEEIPKLLSERMDAFSCAEESKQPDQSCREKLKSFLEI